VPKLPRYYGNTKPVVDAVLKAFFFWRGVMEEEYLWGVPKCHYVFLLIQKIGIPSFNKRA
jgi:hypothetical protein